MAARPSVEGRPSTDSKRLQSHGRGGAGNVSTDVEQLNQTDLVTPRLTGAVYTSGRGGSGNMTHNDPNHPEVARAAQDVDGAPPRLSSTFHAGRGGAGNAGRSSTDSRNLAEAQQDHRPYSEDGDEHGNLPQKANGQGDLRGWADKGKDFLFGRRK